MKKKGSGLAVILLLFFILRLYAKVDNFLPSSAPTVKPTTVKITPTVAPTKLVSKPKTPTPPVNKPIVIADDSNVNIRNGPGKEYGIIGKLLAGKSLEIVGRNHDVSWWQVPTPNGLGWVAASVTTARNVDRSIPIVEVPRTPTVQRKTPTPASQECVPWTVAGLHVGETTCVYGVVTSTYNSGKAFFINFSETDYTGFYGVSFDYTWPNLPGQCVMLGGLVQSYEGRPEIVIDSPSQIQYCN